MNGRNACLGASEARYAKSRAKKLLTLGLTSRSKGGKKKRTFARIPKRFRRFDPSKYPSKGFFHVFSQLQEGDLVLFRTSKRFMPKLQRFACSTSFDHVGIIVICEDCDDDCCSKELKQVRKEANIPAFHTLEADGGGVQVYRFTPACLRSYSGTVFVRHLDLTRLTPAQISKARASLRQYTERMRGRPYARNLMEMLRAAGYGGKNRAEDLTAVFCSELVAAAYREMGIFPNDRLANTYIPADFSTRTAVSKRKKRNKRAVKLLLGASFTPECIIDPENLTVPLPSDTRSMASLEKGSSQVDLLKREALDADAYIVDGGDDDIDLRARLYNPSVLKRQAGLSGKDRAFVPSLAVEDLISSGQVVDVFQAIDRELSEAGYASSSSSMGNSDEESSTIISPESYQSSILIEAGSSHYQPIVIESAPVNIHWDFKLSINAADSHDVAFELLGPLPDSLDISFEEYTVADSSRIESMLPKNGASLPKLHSSRTGKEQSLVSGYALLTAPGRYLFKWDNTYSWFSRKEVHFACTLVYN